MVEYVRRFTNHLLGRLVIILTGVVAVYWGVIQYPPIRPVIEWTFPVILFLWGGSRLYIYGIHKPLTVIAGCLLMAGGLSLALFQLLPMSEMAGTAANLIPFSGILAEIYADHYRKQAEQAE